MLFNVEREREKKEKNNKYWWSISYMKIYRTSARLKQLKLKIKVHQQKKVFFFLIFIKHKRSHMLAKRSHIYVGKMVQY